mmetsp:Transcript_32676/g.83490  ORF Transcript_32676/g.83490 Transcript_32676/m.83490 type:complete len:202 (-) Transcript_32676:71-676(-)
MQQHFRASSAIAERTLALFFPGRSKPSHCDSLRSLITPSIDGASSSCGTFWSKQSSSDREALAAWIVAGIGSGSTAAPTAGERSSLTPLHLATLRSKYLLFPAPPPFTAGIVEAAAFGISGARLSDEVRYSLCASWCATAGAILRILLVVPGRQIALIQVGLRPTGKKCKHNVVVAKGWSETRSYSSGGSRSGSGSDRGDI